MNIGERFDFALKECNISNKQIADKFDISSQSISNLKKNDRLNDLISKIATEYDININWLVTGKGHYKIDSKNINSFSQTGENSQQVHTQHNSGAGMIVHPNADTTNIKKEDELQPLFDALLSVSNALDKKDKLKEELTKLISKLPTL
ncbi:helix-turn-helix domain-containing protein [Aliarcobacter butzleri]|nr:helix-turn-helix domain-containing protein [Aliarcobacter butzleri]